MPKVIKPRRFPWRLAFTITAWAALAASTAYAARQVQYFVLTDRHFALPQAGSGVTFEGVHYASRARLTQMFAQDFGRSAFRIPMAERRRRLLAVDWVEDASISRLWPNHLVVHVKERTPEAFVSMPNRHYLLIDSAGVFLSPPARVRFDLPVLSGVSDEQSEKDRSARVGAMSTLIAALGPEAKRISEVDASSLDDLRITTKMDRHAVELWIGDRNFARRFQNFLNHYPEIARTSPQASVFDLRLDDRITTK